MFVTDDICNFVTIKMVGQERARGDWGLTEVCRAHVLVQLDVIIVDLGSWFKVIYLRKPALTLSRSLGPGEEVSRS